MRKTSSDDGYDWPWLFYVGMIELRMSRQEILACTPREFQAYLKIHSKIHSKKKQNDEFKFVDQI